MYRAFGGSTRLYSPREHSLLFKVAARFGLETVLRTAATVIMDQGRLTNHFHEKTPHLGVYLGLAVQYPKVFTNDFRNHLLSNIVARQLPITEREALELGAVITARIAARRERVAWSSPLHAGVRRVKMIDVVDTIKDLIPFSSAEGQ